MIKFGTIGTSWICSEFIAVAKINPNINLIGCYSRSKERAKDFIAQQQIKARAFDNFQDLADNVDAVYIASPNGLHFEQAMYFLSQQKHVFLEKPLAFTFAQASQLREVAMKNKVILMEAFKVIHAPQYSFLDDFVKNTRRLRPHFQRINIRPECLMLKTESLNRFLMNTLEKGRLTICWFTRLN
jgi:predicted dehydrogenase